MPNKIVDILKKKKLKFARKRIDYMGQRILVIYCPTATQIFAANFCSSCQVDVKSICSINFYKNCCNLKYIIEM